ncbi:hypothetical protein YC2023_074195 [Brassica napus]
MAAYSAVLRVFETRLHRSTRPLLRLLGEKIDRYPPGTTTLSILTALDPQTKTLSFLTTSSLVAIVRRRIEIHDLRLLRRS